MKVLNPELSKFLTDTMWKEVQELTSDFNNDPYRMDTIMNVVSGKGQALRLGKMVRLYHSMKANGASREELVRAAKYTMVLIDARKHFLDINKARMDFGIRPLEIKYMEDEI